MDGYVHVEARGGPLADAYLRFIVEDLLPLVEARWGPPAGPHGVMVAGASMGGLISLYALCEYPAVFSAAAGLSTHWVSVASSHSELDKRRQTSRGPFWPTSNTTCPAPGSTACG
jgi:enterochelin esterase-like enzyme